ncbi:MAG: cytochrome c3 family protein [Bryobacteraceae bacterium]
MTHLLHPAFVFFCAGIVCTAADASSTGYAGGKTCSMCHREIATSQAQTAMANTWRGISGRSLPKNFDEKKAEGPDPALRYEIRRDDGGFEFSVTPPDGARLSLPVKAIMGGKRHGISFLAGIDAVGGIPLERRALIECRYVYSPQGSLALSPGFLTQKPSDFEDRLGRVLSPGFERRCLTCHGQPGTLGAGKQGGVRCESCHGPGLAHVASFSRARRNQPAILPKALNRKTSMVICAQCHTGLSAAIHADPLPEDLLVSSQVTALRNSACFIQSGGNIGCTDCHNPHRDSARLAETSVTTCLRCHSASVARHAAICPVNAATDCIRCHMPSVVENSFRLTDHWIRVHPEQGINSSMRNGNFGSLVAPRREFLRIIVAENLEKAGTALQRLKKGDPFSDVAHDMSADPSAPGGGYIGEMQLSQIDPKLAAAAALLPYGGTSGVIDLGDRRVILHRLPRDFKWKADQLFQQASALKNRGELKAAADKDQQALRAYPYFLRALVLMASIVGQAGDSQRAFDILRFAVQFYPKDASAQFDLALTLGKQPSEQIEAFRRAIELDPDMVAAYQSLGAALYSAGQPQSAVETFRQGLRIDPLSAVLYYDLGLALKRQGDQSGATRALSIAAKLDPEIGARDERPAR